jgi:hypothetical protein
MPNFCAREAGQLRTDGIQASRHAQTKRTRVVRRGTDAYLRSFVGRDDLGAGNHGAGSIDDSPVQLDCLCRDYGQPQYGNEQPIRKPALHLLQPRTRILSLSLARFKKKTDRPNLAGEANRLADCNDRPFIPFRPTWRTTS